MKKFGLGTLVLLLATSVSFAQNNDDTAYSSEATTTESTSTTTDKKEDKGVISPGGFFVEPMLSASSQSSEIKTSQLGLPDDTSGDSNGWGAGLKLGVHVSEIFFLGADARYDHVTLKDSSYGEATADGYNYGPTAGVQMPIFGLRLLGTYVVGGEFNPASGAQGVDVKFRDPYGWRAGVGVRILAMSLNLEYQDLKYNKTDVESFGALPGTAASGVDFDNRGYMLSLSFPIEL